MSVRPRRSLLYVPASNRRALEKARALPADGLIFDLEDAVAPEAKDLAREQLVAALAAGGYEGRELVVRINGRESPWRREDLAAVAAIGPDAVLAPKISGPEDVAEATAAIEAAGAPAHTRLWAMVETPRAVLEAGGIARMGLAPSARLAVLVLGTNDLAKETRARQVEGRAPMLAWLSMVVAAARAYGLDVLDGVFADVGDLDGLRRECGQGRDLGMDGKTLIHPDQIALANQGFAPSAEEIAQAREIVAIFARPENAGRGVVSIGGRMVERLHADIARRTLRLAEALEARAR